MIMIDKAKKLFSLMYFSLHISLKASVSYTVFRFVQNIVSNLIPIFTSILTSEVVNSFVGYSESTRKRLVILLFAITFVSIVSMLMDNLGEYVISVHSNIINNYLEVNFSKKASELDLSFFDSAKFYNLLANAKRDSSILPIFIYQSIQIISSVITLITSFLIILNYNVFLSVITLLAIIPSIVINKHYARIMFEWENGNVDKLRKKAYFYNLLTSRQFSQDIRFFQLSNYFIERFNNIWVSWFLDKKKLDKKRTVISILTNVVPILCIGIFLLNLGFSILEGDKSPGDFVLYSSQLQNLQAALLMITSCIVTIYDNKLRLNNLEDFFELTPTINYRGDREIEVFESIEFDNVSFLYPGTSNYALKDISFRINARDKVAIVGINGAGKTTLIKLILRFYDPTEGIIRVNGIDIKEYNVGSVRKLFGVMFQEYNTYAFTIEENICLNDLEKTNMSSKKTIEENVKQCLGLSGADTFVSELLEGVQSYVSREYSENGIVMSTGIKQKLSLAGMFYRRCSFILLDEPSASLDPESEYKLFRSISTLSADKTLLFISHRLANVNMADKIMVIENGIMLESGSHDELMSRCGRYYELYNYQIKKE